jgi:hypothetical protein
MVIKDFRQRRRDSLTHWRDQTTGRRCIAGFRSGECPQWVIRERCRRSGQSGNVRFAPKATLFIGEAKRSDVPLTTAIASQDFCNGTLRFLRRARAHVRPHPRRTH